MRARGSLPSLEPLLLPLVFLVAIVMASSSEAGSSWWQLLLAGGGCMAVGIVLGRRFSQPKKPVPPPSSPVTASQILPAPVMTEIPDNDSEKKKKTPKTKPPLEIEELAKIMDDFKMVLVVRNDLKMGKGKIAAQCSHATLGLYKKIHKRAPLTLERWEMCGQVKVVTKVENESDLLSLQSKANMMKLLTHIVIDAGRTQIAPNSKTVMSVLGPAELVDEVTGGLKLL